MKSVRGLSWEFIPYLYVLLELDDQSQQSQSARFR